MPRSQKTIYCASSTRVQKLASNVTIFSANPGVLCRVPEYVDSIAQARIPGASGGVFLRRMCGEFARSATVSCGPGPSLRRPGVVQTCALSTKASVARLSFLFVLAVGPGCRPNPASIDYRPIPLSDRSGCGGCSLLGRFGRKLREAHQGEFPCPGGCSDRIETCNRRQFRMLSAIAEKPSSHWSSRTAETFAIAPQMPSSSCTNSSNCLTGIKTGLC